eukprot:Skav219500  [mRNA]  locus=scaffold937:322651:323907:+ [translate_table: standard]
MVARLLDRWCLVVFYISAVCHHSGTCLASVIACQTQATESLPPSGIWKGAWEKAEGESSAGLECPTRPSRVATTQPSSLHQIASEDDLALWTMQWQATPEEPDSASKSPKERQKGEERPGTGKWKWEVGLGSNGLGTIPCEGSLGAVNPEDESPDSKDGEMAEDKPLPPAPILPVPPMAPNMASNALSADELKLMTNLQGVKNYSPLPDELAQQLESLETRHQESLNAKALSHGHLNRLHKIRKQAGSLVKEIQAVDQDWRQFVAEAYSRLGQHASMYQEHRASLMEQLAAKNVELNAIKEEVSSASRTLMEQSAFPQDNIENVDIAADLSNFQATAGQMGLVSGPTIELSDLEDEDMTSQQEHGPGKGPRRVALRPFRNAGSPGKVAHTHLKPKENKENKEKAKENKESKEMKEEAG